MLKPILFHLWIPGLAMLAAVEGFKVEPPVTAVEQPKENETAVQAAAPVKPDQTNEVGVAEPVQPKPLTKPHPPATLPPAPPKAEVAPAEKPSAEVTVAETPKPEALESNSPVRVGATRAEARAEARAVVKPKSIAPSRPVPSAKAKLLAVAMAQANGQIALELSYRDDQGATHQVRMCGSKNEVKCQLQRLPKPISQFGSELLKGN